MYKLNEVLMSDDRALLTIQGSKNDIDRNLKSGMLNYVGNEHHDLFLTIPTSKDYGSYNRVIQEEPDGKIPYDLVMKGSLTIEKNLVVLGDSTVISTPNMTVEDNIIEINKGETGNGVTLGSSGIQVDRGTKGNANWLFSESSDVNGVSAFVFDTNGSVKTWVYENGDMKVLRDFSSQKITAGGTIRGLSNMIIDGTTQLNSTLGVTGAATLANTLSVTGATSLLNSLTTTGATWLKSTLRADGATTLNSTLTTVGAATFQNTIHGVGAATLDSTLFVDGATTLDSTLAVTAGTTLNSTLNVIGLTTLSGGANITGNVQANNNMAITGTLTVTGATALNSTATVAGATTLNSTLNVIGNTTATTATFSGAVNMSSTLGVTGIATLKNDVIAQKKLNVTGATVLGNTLNVVGAADFDSTLNVDGAMTVATLTASGATEIQNAFSVTGDTTLGAKLTVTGATALNSTLNVAQGATINNSLLVTGYANIDEHMNVGGDLNAHSNLFVSGTSSLTGAVTAVGGFTSVGQSTLVGATQIVTSLTVEGPTTLKSPLSGTAATFSGATILQDTLSVTKAATFAAAVNAQAALNVTGATTLNNTLTAAGNTNLNADLTVGGNSTLVGILGVTGAVTLGNTLNVTGTTSLAGMLNVTGLSTLGNTSVTGTLAVTKATTLASTLGVTGATTLQSTLSVIGAATLSSTLGVTGTLTGSIASFSGNLSTQSGLTVNGTSTLKNNVTMESNANVLGTATIATLSVTGNSTVSGTQTIGGAANFLNDVTMQKSLDVLLNASIHGGMLVEGDVSIAKNGSGTGGGLTVAGAGWLKSTLTVDGASTFNQTVTANKPVVINDNVTHNYKVMTLKKHPTTGIGGELAAEGNASFGQNLSVGQTATINTLSVTGVSTIGGQFTANSIANFKEAVTFEKNVLVSGTLNVSQDTSLTAALTVGGASLLSSTLTVQGVSTLNGQLQAKAGIAVTGNSTVSGNSSVTGTFGVTGAFTASNTATIAGAATLQSTLGVTGAATLSSTLSVAGITTLSQDANLLQKLTVTGVTYLKSNLMVDGSTTLNNIVTANSVVNGNAGFVATTGYGFSEVADSRVYVTSSAAANGGRLDLISDSNMYFRMPATGVNRGFVFKTGDTPIFQIETGRVTSQNDIYVKSGLGWTRLLRADEQGTGNSVDVDTVDGRHADVTWEGKPNYLATYNSLGRVVDSDKIDGYNAGNGSGQVPVSNGALNTNLNADLFESKHGAAAATGDTFALRDTGGGITATSFKFANSLVKEVSGGIHLRNLADTAWVDLTVNNLIIKGTTTTVDSETVTIADNILLLNSNVTGAATENGGIQVERGTTGADASLIWDETTDKWKAGIAGSETEISLVGHTHVRSSITDFAHKSTHAIGGNDVLSPADIGAVKNGGSTPEIRTGLEADRPAAGQLGRLYLATDTKRIWQDLTTGWQVTGGQDTTPWSNITGIPVATATVPGVVKIGANISVSADGTISTATNPDAFMVRRKEFITTAGQTVFSVAGIGNGFLVGKNLVNVYLQGQKLPNSAFTETSSTSITLKEAVSTGSLIEVEFMEVFDIHVFPYHANEHLPGGEDPIPAATTVQSGLMTAASLVKLNGVATSASRVGTSLTNGNIKVNDVETKVYRPETFTHSQSTAATLWTVNHNQTRFPAIIVVDVDGYVIQPLRIRYVSNNQITVEFSSATAGSAYIN